MISLATTRRTKRHLPAIGALLIAAASPAASAEVRYYHTDILGSVAAISDETGTIIERREYTPYGAQLSAQPKGGPGFTGHVGDASTGMIQMQQRSMDPEAGRFVSVDPVSALDAGNLIHFNRYAYAYNNPTSVVDPDGRCPWCIGAGIGVGLDLIFQVGELAMGKRSEINGKSLLISGISGAAGVGLAGKLKQVGGLLADTALSAGTTAAKGEDVTLIGLAADVVAGEVGGQFVAQKIRQSVDYKIEQKDVDRLQRIGQKPAARPAQRERAVAAEAGLERGVAQKAGQAGVVAGGLGQGLVELYSDRKEARK